jgi:hypothetical protein
VGIVGAAQRLLVDLAWGGIRQDFVVVVVVVIVVVVAEG